jgi:hypothetical protein
MAKDEIESSTRGFSGQLRAPFGASKPKNPDGFSRPRPNGFRTDRSRSRSKGVCAHCGSVSYPGEVTFNTTFPMVFPLCSKRIASSA